MMQRPYSWGGHDGESMGSPESPLNPAMHEVGIALMTRIRNRQLAVIITTDVIVL